MWSNYLGLEPLRVQYCGVEPSEITFNKIVALMHGNGVDAFQWSDSNLFPGFGLSHQPGKVEFSESFGLGNSLVSSDKPVFCAKPVELPLITLEKMASAHDLIHYWSVDLQGTDVTVRIHMLVHTCMTPLLIRCLPSCS